MRSYWQSIENNLQNVKASYTRANKNFIIRKRIWKKISLTSIVSDPAVIFKSFSKEEIEV